jgi:hypothetical protein
MLLNTQEKRKPAGRKYFQMQQFQHTFSTAVIELWRSALRQKESTFKKKLSGVLLQYLPDQ